MISPTNAKPEENAPQPRRGTWRWALLAGIIAAAAAATICLWLAGEKGDGDAGIEGRCGKDGPSLIASQEPAQPHPTVQQPDAKPEKRQYKDLTREEKLQYYRDKYGDDIPDNLKPVVYYLENEPKRHFRARSDKAAIFRRRSERDIASFLLVEPGTRMVRPVTFGERFDRDLAAALSEPIEIADEDTEEQRSLKEAVIAVKNELGERAKAGENPSQIMTEAARELYQLGQYRDDLEAEIRAIKNDPTKSDDDLSVAVEAANRMLEKKGLKPLRQPNMLIRRANLRKRQARNEEGGK